MIKDCLRANLRCFISIIGLFLAIMISLSIHFEAYGEDFPRKYPVGVDILKYDDESCDSPLPSTNIGRVYAVKFSTLHEGLVTLIKIADNQALPPPGGQLRSFVVRLVAGDGYTDLTPPMTIQIGDGVGVYKYIDMANKGVRVIGTFYVVVQRTISVQDNGVCLDTASNSGNSYGDIPAPGSSSPIIGPGNSNGNIMIQVIVDTQKTEFFWGAPGSTDSPLLMDVDMDTQLDPVIFRNGTWFISMSTRCYDTQNRQCPCSNFCANTGSPLIFYWGTSGDIPFAGDVNGDGLGPTDCDLHGCGSFDDLIVWRPSNGTWYIQLLRHDTGVPTPSTQLPPISWGANGDVPLVSPRWSDFDGDGKVDLVIWRPSNGHWYVLLSSKGYNPSATGGSLTYAWGSNGDIPLVEDIDFDGKADLIVWRSSNGHWYILLSSRAYSYTNPLIIPWGTQGDSPLIVSGYSLRSADLAVWRPSNGNWYILIGDSGYHQSRIIAWGTDGDIPLGKPMEPAISGGGPWSNVISEHGDFDADLWSDLIIYRPSSGTWYPLLSGGDRILLQY